MLTVFEGVASRIWATFERLYSGPTYNCRLRAAVTGDGTYAQETYLGGIPRLTC